MGSISKELRETQLNKAVADFDAIKVSLKEKGLDDKQAAKNAIYRQLKAEVTKARRRIHAIENAAAHVEAIKQKETKAEKVAKTNKKTGPAPIPAQKSSKTKGSKKKK